MEVPKLSEAILLGIGLVRNERRTYLHERPLQGPCGCALGTPLYALGESIAAWVATIEPQEVEHDPSRTTSSTQYPSTTNCEPEGKFQGVESGCNK